MLWIVISELLIDNEYGFVLFLRFCRTSAPFLTFLSSWDPPQGNYIQPIVPESRSNPKYLRNHCRCERGMLPVLSCCVCQVEKWGDGREEDMMSHNCQHTVSLSQWPQNTCLPSVWQSILSSLITPVIFHLPSSAHTTSQFELNVQQQVNDV